MLSLFSYVKTNDDISGIFTSNTTALKRAGRTNYGPYPPPKVYGAIGEYKDDSNADPELSPYNDKTVRDGDQSSTGKYKGYDLYNDYSPPRYQPFANNYKGYPLNSGGFQPSNTDQMLQMMLAVKGAGVATKPEETGLLSKFTVDPNIASTAIIPLSIVAAAVAPVLVNLLMGSTSTPVISTTAGNRQARSYIVSHSLQSLIENMSSFARAMDKDECIQKTICKVACDQSAVPVPDYVKKVATTIAHLVGDDLLNNLQIKNLIDGIKNGNCSNVCNSSKVQSRYM
ncbi:uncharacterized protein NPIL_459251 [Nephila pilipes]|uniref:Uncharacterized protein n=1 Tax=Nephila pilipes TaxID=299642 RepID=A0A8X6UV50_NEPPI|nr:uncharacterized protein NPIL_459251 [Nephila pilipes]